MLQIGKRNRLQIERSTEHGLILNDGLGGEILLPRRYVTPSHQIGDEVDVFVYYDSEDRIVAITDGPVAEVGQFAYLQVVAISKYGVFLDWGLPKDLFVPWREQPVSMREGERYIVYIYFDQESSRIAASSRLHLFLNNVKPRYREGEEVAILVYGETDLGYKVIIENMHEGLLYKNEVFSPLQVGYTGKAAIKKIREDDKIDLSLYKLGYKKVGDATDIILQALQQSTFIPVTDKTDAEEINRRFGMSKKTFKQAIGSLYKQKLISIEDGGIRLNK